MLSTMSRADCSTHRESPVARHAVVITFNGTITSDRAVEVAYTFLR
jgi:hypothetical protein